MCSGAEGIRFDAATLRMYEYLQLLRSRIVQQRSFPDERACLILFRFEFFFIPFSLSITTSFRIRPCLVRAVGIGSRIVRIRSEVHSILMRTQVHNTATYYALQRVPHIDVAQSGRIHSVRHTNKPYDE